MREGLRTRVPIPEDVEYRTLNFRFAEEIFESHEFSELKWELYDLVKRSPAKQRPKPEGKITTDQDAMNRWFEEEFRQRGWEVKPYVTDKKITDLRADFKKKRVQVEVQFGNVARAIYDIFKMQISYSLGLIDVGVLILPLKDFAKTMGDNIAHFERVARELPYAKMSITLPILVIGIAPSLPGQKKTSKRAKVSS